MKQAKQRILLAASSLIVLDGFQIRLHRPLLTNVGFEDARFQLLMRVEALQRFYIFFRLRLSGGALQQQVHVIFARVSHSRGCHTVYVTYLRVLSLHAHQKRKSGVSSHFI